MTRIYSRIQPSREGEPGKLLHMIVRKQDIPTGRTDLCPPEEFIQCAALRLNKGTTFKPHRHIWYHYNDDRIPQESWLCVRGSVKVFLYDLDDTLLHTDIILAGEASFTFEAAHTYEILEDETFVMEYKTGKYYGQEFDKKFIEPKQE